MKVITILALLVAGIQPSLAQTKALVSVNRFSSSIAFEGFRSLAYRPIAMSKVAPA
jgi:hypothetical protein